MNRTNQALIAIWAVIAASIAFLIADVASSRRLLVARLHDQAVSYVRLIEQHASAAFDRCNVGLAAVMDQVSAADMAAGERLSEKRRKRIDARLQDQRQRTSGVVAMFLADAGGGIFAHTTGDPAGVNVGDRSYFQTLRREAGAGLAISEAIPLRVTRTWGVTVGRRVEFADGRFAGVAAASLGLAANFTDFYASLPLGKDSAITLRDPENRLLVRHPNVESKLGQTIASGGWIAERLRAGDKEGVATIASNIDGIERVFAFRRLDAYPIYAAVGLSLDEALAGWRVERNDLVLNLSLLLLAGGFITVALRRNQRAEAALARESLRNRMLLRSASEGICIVDANGRVQDASDAFCGMLGYAREELLGMHVSQWDKRWSTQEGAEELRRLHASTGQTLTFESRNRRKDGSTLDVEIYSVGLELGAETLLFLSSRDVSERKRVQEHIQHQAHYDALTGIPNRSLFYDRLAQGIVLAKRDRYELALLYLDLDKFKGVNDALGHVAGDEVLRIAAARIRRLLRESDSVARIGGDEFTVILPRIASQNDAAEVAAKIVDALAAPMKLENANAGARQVRVGCSVGIAIFPGDADSPDSLMVAADAAMYEAKRAMSGYCFNAKAGSP